VAVRPTYGSRKTIRIDEFDRREAGGAISDGHRKHPHRRRRVVNKVVEHPQSTLHVFPLEPEDVKELERIRNFR